MIYATKYVILKESTRDHVDLLLSMKYWPVVNAVDMACDVVAHTEVRLPALANELWGEQRGCFEKPSTASNPKVTTCVYIQNRQLPLCRKLSRSLLNTVLLSCTIYIIISPIYMHY